MPAERLQKIIAAAGVASRRKAEELITSGRVQVNDQMVTELGTNADPEQDHIRLDGKLLRGPERYSYIVLNKPRGYVTTVSDPEKRPTVMDLVRSVRGRVYPVGRLDWASEGLLLLTNDGELANALMKASSNVPKTYVVTSARSLYCRERRPPGAHGSGADQADPRGRQSLAGSNHRRRAQPAGPQNVRRGRAPRRENPESAVWSALARRAARRVSQPLAGRSRKAEKGGLTLEVCAIRCSGLTARVY